MLFRVFAEFLNDAHLSHPKQGYVHRGRKPPPRPSLRGGITLVFACFGVFVETFFPRIHFMSSPRTTQPTNQPTPDDDYGCTAAPDRTINNGKHGNKLMDKKCSRLNGQHRPTRVPSATNTTKMECGARKIWKHHNDIMLPTVQWLPGAGGLPTAHTLTPPGHPDEP